MSYRYFTKHLDPDQIQAVQAHVSAGGYGSELPLGQSLDHECAVVFFDLANFTNISWSLTRQQVLQIVQPLFEYTCNSVYGHRGMVDKYPGDGVVAFFPRYYGVEKNDIVDQCIDCATQVMHWFYNRLRPLIVLPKPSHTLELCVGIDSGTVSIAHVGTPLHSELILLGHQVNCASKCQAAADAKEMVIGQDAVDSLHHGGFYGQYLSTGPNIGVVYTADNRPYLSKRLDWKGYSEDHSWVRS